MSLATEAAEPPRGHSPRVAFVQKSRWPALWACALVLGLVAEAEARVRWSTPGSYRLRADVLGELPLDEQQTDTGQRLRGRHRVRIDPTIEAGALTVHLQIDVLTGQIFGDTNAVGADFVERRYGNPQRWSAGWTTVEPRMLWFEYELDWGALQLGQLGNEWGMGVVASGGADPVDDRWVERFGDRWAGDLLARALVMVRPFGFFTPGILSELELAVGGDHVYQDEYASFLGGDSALQVVSWISWPGEVVQWGGYFSRRWQTDLDGSELRLNVFDAYLSWQIPLYMMGADLRLQLEVVLQTGRTDALRPSESPEGVDLLQLGWVSRAELAWRCPRVAVGLEVGYASGDANPDDGQRREMTFDPDHRVGFILFSDVMRLITLRGAERLADASRFGAPESSAAHHPTGGGVRNAIYVFPGVTWRPGPWRITGAGLLAWADEPFADPYQTLLAGGTARNHRGRQADRFYGVEMLGALHYEPRLLERLNSSVGIMGGAFLPGAALAGEGVDDPVYKIQLRFDLRW